MTSLHHPLRRFAVAITAACLAVGCSATPTATPADPTTSTSSSTTIAAGTECTTAQNIADVLAGTDFSDRAGLEALPDSVRSLTSVVPAELAPDVETLASALDDFVALLREYDFDLTKIDNDPAAQSRLGDMNDPAVTEATQRIQDWLDTSCAGS